MRESNRLTPAISLLLASIPTIVSLRDVFPGHRMLLAGIAPATLMLSLCLIPRPGIILRSPQSLFPILAMCAMTLVMVIHAGLRNEVPIDTLLGVTLMLCTGMASGFIGIGVTDDHRLVANIGLNSIVILIMTSTFLHFAGLESQGETGFRGVSGTLLGRYGFGLVRTNMPLTLGMTTHGTFSGIAALVCLHRLWDRRLLLKLVFLLGLACSLFGLIVTDGRAAVTAFVALSVGGSLIPRFLYTLSPFLLPFSSVVYLGGISYLPAGVLQLISRTGDAREILSGNQRAVVWSAIRNHFVDNPQSLAAGYGILGQAASRVSDKYSSIFANWGGSHQYYTAHNAGLQLLLDGGLIAVIVFLAGYSTIIARYVRAWTSYGDVNDRLCCLVLVFLMLVGVLDISGTPTQRDSFYMVILLGFASGIIPDWEQAPDQLQSGAPDGTAVGGEHLPA